MVNKLINEMLSKEELKKLPVLIHTLTVKTNKIKKTTTKNIKSLNKQFYKNI